MSLPSRSTHIANRMSPSSLSSLLSLPSSVIIRGLVVVVVVVIAEVRGGNEGVDVELLGAGLEGLGTAIVVDISNTGIIVYELDGKINSLVRL